MLQYLIKDLSNYLFLYLEITESVTHDSPYLLTLRLSCAVFSVHPPGF